MIEEDIKVSLLVITCFNIFSQPYGLVSPNQVKISSNLPHISQRYSETNKDMLM